MKRKNVMKKIGCLVLALSMTSALVTGCGSDEKGASASSVTTIKVGTGQAWAPYCYLDENGELTGYDVELLKALDEKMPDYKLDIQGMDFSTNIVSIDSGALDMVSYQLVQSDERKQKYIFPDISYCYSPLSLCVRADSGISNFDDMVGKTIQSDPTTFEYTLLSQYNEQHPGKEFVIDAVSGLSQADSYKRVSSGQVDASLTYMTAFETTIPQIGVENLVMTDAVLIEESYYMINKDKTEFRDAITKALQEAMDDGTMSELSTKWFGEDYFTKYADMINYDL